MSEWKYIDSIAELSDFECAHCDTRDFYMVTYDTISQPWKVLNKFLKKNRIIVEQCSFNKDEIIPLLKVQRLHRVVRETGGIWYWILLTIGG